MKDSYIDSETTLLAFATTNAIDQDVLLGLRTNYPDWNHPALVLTNLYEVHQYAKHLICLMSDAKSGQSSNATLYLLDKFCQSKSEIQEEVGQYLVILSATRESSTNKYNFISKIVKKKRGHTVIDINQFFPINMRGKPPQIILPPTSQATVLVGTPQSFLKLLALAPIEQAGIFAILYDECALMKVFGGEEQLREVYQWVQRQSSGTRGNDAVHLFIGSEEQVEQICTRRPTTIAIEVEELDHDNEEEDEVIEKPGAQGNYFYHVSKDEVQKFIIVYITLKLNLLHGKTLVLVEDLPQLYKMQLFLQRCGLEKFQIYNSENPKSLKYYVLSTFNTGVLQILIATPSIIGDLKTEFFERSSNKNKKKKGKYSFKNVDNIIVLDLNPNSIEFAHHLNGKGNVLVVEDQTDEENIENLIHWMNNVRNTDVNLKPYPLSLQEIEAFRYRIEDVCTNISKHQVKMAQTLDFKKKMLKSPDLVEYFKLHPKEKELIQQQIVQTRAQLRKFEIRADGLIPDYLIPQIIMQQRKMQNESKKLTRILVSKTDENKQMVMQKRKLLAKNTTDMLPKEIEGEEVCISEYGVQQEVIQKKVNMGGNKYVYVNEANEDPNLVDTSRLPQISSRKLWKLKHGFKLKKRNKRMEKKGVFTT